MDLSSPGGPSVNDGIDPDEFTMQYITVDQIIHMISNYYGLGALIAEFDVKAAYHMKELFIEVSTVYHSQFIFIFIFLQGKLCVSACISKSLVGACFLALKKCYLSVMFAP